MDHAIAGRDSRPRAAAERPEPTRAQHKSLLVRSARHATAVAHSSRSAATGRLTKGHRDVASRPSCVDGRVCLCRCARARAPRGPRGHTAETAGPVCSRTAPTPPPRARLAPRSLASRSCLSVREQVRRNPAHRRNGVALRCLESHIVHQNAGHSPRMLHAAQYRIQAQQIC